MKFSLKTVALGALLATSAVAAPIVARDAASDRIAACFVNLLFTGQWPGNCQAAVAVNSGLIKGITINQMSMDFTGPNPWAPSTSSSNIVATMLSIPGINLPIDSVAQHIILQDNGVDLGYFDTPWSAASVSNGALTTSFASSALNVYPGSEVAFATFIGELAGSPTRTLGLRGSVDAKLNLGIFGHLTIPGIGFQTTTPLAGLNGLKTLKFIYFVDVDFSVANEIIMTAIVNINNPSKLTLNLGDITLNAATSEGPVGTSFLKALSLVPGDNYVLSRTAMLTSNPAALDLLNNLYVANQDLLLTGFAGTSADPALAGGLAQLASTLTVPVNFQGSAMSHVPYDNWSLATLPTTNTDRKVSITATFYSPYYGFPIQMTSSAPPGNSNQAIVDGVTGANGYALFNIADGVTFSVTGTGHTTVTFTALLKNAPFVASEATKWNTLIAFAATNGYIPVDLNWIANLVINNDGNTHQVDWGTAGTGTGVIKVKVGADFASIINGIPTA